jgi:hypothetical protein
MRRLLGSVTAVVIGSHVRPSFYWALTGAIYLDAVDVWRTPAERDTVSEVPDPRSDFGRELAYASPWRYTVGNSAAQLNFPRPARQSRDASYLVYELGQLLYHELAHANDFMPPAQRARVQANRVFFASVPGVGLLPSDRLAATMPLSSQQCFGLASVKFFGASASVEQKSWSPVQVADFFRGDRATDEYSYSRPPGAAVSREDIAMLFEEFMMSHRHGTRRDVAFTTPFFAGATSADLIVAWGSRGRIGETAVRPRVRQIVADLAPWIDLNAVDVLPAPLAMRPGESWAANLVLLPPTAMAMSAERAPRGAPRPLTGDLGRRAGAPELPPR